MTEGTRDNRKSRVYGICQRPK